MKHVVLLTLLFCFSAGVLADIGPSPSYSFAVVNAPAYPEYTFFYLGQIMGAEITGETSVYKLDTEITVYAVLTENFSSGLTSPNSVSEEMLSECVASQPIRLGAGTNLFEITKFNENTKSMALSLAAREPPFMPDSFYFGLDPFLLVTAVIVLVVIVGGAFWLNKRGK